MSRTKRETKADGGSLGGGITGRTTDEDAAAFTRDSFLGKDDLLAEDDDFKAANSGKSVDHSA